MVHSAVMQPKRRRQGLKRIGTNLKILLDDPVDHENNDDDNKKNDGVFLVHKREVVYGKIISM